MNIHKKNGTLVQRGFRDNSKIKMCIKNRTKKKQNDKKEPENNSSHINEESGQHFCGRFTGYFIWVTRRVPLVDREFAIMVDPSSSPVINGICFDQSFVLFLNCFMHHYSCFLFFSYWSL